MTTDIYGHKQLDLFFIPLVKVSEDYFEYKSKKYAWNEIKEVLIWNPFSDMGGIFGTAAAARATIILKDGKKIRIYSRILHKKGSKYKIDFISAKSSVFDELIKIFKEKIS